MFSHNWSDQASQVRTKRKELSDAHMNPIDRIGVIFILGGNLCSVFSGCLLSCSRHMLDAERLGSGTDAIAFEGLEWWFSGTDSRTTSMKLRAVRRAA